MPTQIVGEQTPRAYGIVGPWVFSGSLAANTPTSILVSGANAFEHKIPLLSASLVAAMSSYRNTGYTAGDVTIQLASIAAAAAAGTALTPISGASMVAPAAGGPVYNNLLIAGGVPLNAGDMLGIILTAASAGTCLLTVNLVVTT